MQTQLATLFFSSEFISAICGAIVGGLISLITQRQANKAQARQIKEDKAELKRAIGFSILYKRLQMQTIGHRVMEYYQEGFRIAEKEKMNLSACIRPLANPPQEIRFSSDEMALLLSINADDALNELMNLDALYNTVASFQYAYERKREQVDGLMGAVDTMDGIRGTFPIDEDTRRRIAPIVAGLDDLVVNAKNMSETLASRADRSLNLLKDTLPSKLGLQFRTHPVNGDAQPVP